MERPGNILPNNTMDNADIKEKKYVLGSRTAKEQNRTEHCLQLQA